MLIKPGFIHHIFITMIVSQSPLVTFESWFQNDVSYLYHT